MSDPVELRDSIVRPDGSVPAPDRATAAYWRNADMQVTLLGGPFHGRVKSWLGRNYVTWTAPEFGPFEMHVYRYVKRTDGARFALHKSLTDEDGLALSLQEHPLQ